MTFDSGEVAFYDLVLLATNHEIVDTSGVFLDPAAYVVKASGRPGCGPVTPMPAAGATQGI